MYRKKTGASLLQNAMQIVGFLDHEAEAVLEVVAAVLKLGNIEFKPESRVNGLDESKIKDKNGKLVDKQFGLGNLL
jgi:myosin heavy subunit